MVGPEGFEPSSHRVRAEYVEPFDTTDRLQQMESNHHSQGQSLMSCLWTMLQLTGQGSNLRTTFVCPVNSRVPGL